MLTFPLRKEYFYMIKHGVKTWEYRELKKYWATRLIKLKIGDIIKFTCGYDKQHIKAKVEIIKVVDFENLPDHAKQFFIESDCDRFFGINFKVL